jgi:hypothetical protein
MSGSVASAADPDGVLVVLVRPAVEPAVERLDLEPRPVDQPAPLQRGEPVHRRPAAATSRSHRAGRDGREPRPYSERRVRSPLHSTVTHRRMAAPTAVCNNAVSESARFAAATSPRRARTSDGETTQLLFGACGSSCWLGSSSVVGMTWASDEPCRRLGYPTSAHGVFTEIGSEVAMRRAETPSQSQLPRNTGNRHAAELRTLDAPARSSHRGDMPLDVGSRARACARGKTHASGPAPATGPIALITSRGVGTRN